MSARLKRRLLIPSTQTAQAVEQGQNFAPVRVRRLRPALGVRSRRRRRQQFEGDPPVALAAEGPWGPAGFPRGLASFAALLIVAVALIFSPAEEFSLKAKRNTSHQFLDVIPEYVLNRPSLPRTDSQYVIDDPKVSPYLSLSFPEAVHSINENENESAISPRYVFCSTPSSVEGADRLARALWNRPPTRDELAQALDMAQSGRIVELLAQWVESMERGTGKTVGGMVDALFGEILEMAPSQKERHFYGRLMASGGLEWMHAAVDLFERRRYLDVARFACSDEDFEADEDKDAQQTALESNRLIIQKAVGR
ncbi:hypothetical protein BC829DRAFT_73608 [Chytridium lagenaria]|nr:hypothetical protein BC829DRAFT_73608 [Chytridium lagenaria]